MARIIVYSDFLKSGAKKHILNDFEYIGTREGVSLNQFDYAKYMKPLHPASQIHSVTDRQRQLIDAVLKRFPETKDTISYELFNTKENMYTASVFIAEAMELIEAKTCDNNIYMQYISERPGVVFTEGIQHGLFDEAGAADYNRYYQELDKHEGNVWRHIISMRREDAVTYGYESQKAWRDLISKNVKQLAAKNGISPENLRWVAAFHDEGYHPHCHIMTWSADPKEGFQNKEALIDFRKALTKDVFADELWLREQYKSEIRDSFEERFEKEFQSLMDSAVKACESELVPIAYQLSEIAEMLPRKHHSYGYLSAPCKDRINKLVEYITSLPQVQPLVNKYLESHRILGSMYMKDDSRALNNYLKESLQKLIAPDKADRKKLHNYIVKAIYEYKQNLLDKQELLKLRAADIDKKMTDPIYQIQNEKLGERLLKLLMLQGVDSLEAIKIAEPYFENSDNAILCCLDFKKDLSLSDADITAIKKHFDASLNVEQEIMQDSLPIHEAAKIFHYVLSFMQEGKMQADREAHRLFCAHRQVERDVKIQQAKK